MCFEPEQEVRTSATNEKPEARPEVVITDIPADVATVLLHSRVRIPNVLVAVAILQATDGDYILDLNTAPDDEVSLGLSAGEYFAYSVRPDASKELAVTWLTERAAQLKKEIEENLRLVDWMRRLHSR